MTKFVVLTWKKGYKEDCIFQKIAFEINNIVRVTDHSKQFPDDPEITSIALKSGDEFWVIETFDEVMKRINELNRNSYEDTKLQ